MIEINKCKLVPGITSSWGDILGDITKQQDLVDYVASHGGGVSEWGSITGNLSDQDDLMTLLDEYAKKDWVESQGYLVQDDLSQYATRQWVTGRGYITSDALNGYATEQWVGQQGYITSSALSGYATEQWVENQGYIDHIKTVNNQSLIGEGNIEISGLTPEQEDAIEPLMNPEEGMLYTFEIGPRTILRKRTDMFYTNQFLYKLGDEVYLIKDYEVYLFDGTNFNSICHLQNWDGVPFWMDDSGRVYNGTGYQSNLETGDCTSVNLCPNGGYYTNGAAVHNIWHGDDGIYLMCEFYDATLDKNIVYKFNEDTQLFDIPCVENNTSGIGLYDMMLWYDGLKDYEGHHIGIVGTTMYEVSDGEDSITCTSVTEYFPVTLPNGNYVNMKYFHNVGGEYYCLRQSNSSGQNYKLVEGQWVEMSYDSDILVDFSDTSVDTDKLIFGGYNGYDWIPIVNPRNETYVATSWQSVKSVAVDLDSEQSIKGLKTFENINVNGQINCNRFNSDTIQILGNNIVIGVDQRNSTLNLSGVSIMNGDYIQAKGEGFFNVTKDEFGPLSRSMTQYTGSPLSYDFNNIWTTPSGRVFNSNGSQCYEMMDTEQTAPGDWSNWKAMTMTVYPGYCASRIITGGGELYYVKYDDSKIYKWDEANSDWVSYIDYTGSDYGSMAYVNGTIMCYGNGHIYRYDTNDNMFVQAYDDPNGNWTTGKILELNGSVYQVSEYELHEVEFQNGVVTYNVVSSIQWNYKERSFVLGGYIFVCSNRVHKLDLSKVGTYEFETQLNYVPEGEDYRGPWTDGTDTCMMVCDSGEFWLMYDLNYSKPEVPSTDGTYVLKATVQDGEVTYEWVPDNVL